MSKIVDLVEFKKTNEYKKIAESDAFIKTAKDYIYFFTDNLNEHKEYDNVLVYKICSDASKSAIYQAIVVMFDMTQKKPEKSGSSNDIVLDEFHEIRTCKRCREEFISEKRWNNHISYFCDDCGKIFAECMGGIKDD